VNANRSNTKEEDMHAPSAHRSSRRFRKLVAITIASAVCGSVVAGAALATKPGDPSTGATDLYRRVLRPGELRGYVPYFCTTVTWTARRWAADNSLAAASLKANGFVAGLREPLASRGSSPRVVSTVALFRSVAGARRELDGELVQAGATAIRFRTLRVTGIPGARAYVASTRSVSRLAVSFSIGRHTYTVVVAARSRAQVDALGDRALDAARVLYRRLGPQA
jgi:hypothetical protein